MDHTLDQHQPGSPRHINHDPEPLQAVASDATSLHRYRAPQPPCSNHPPSHGGRPRSHQPADAMLHLAANTAGKHSEPLLWAADGLAWLALERQSADSDVIDVP
jgi:hypothetical protein